MGLRGRPDFPPFNADPDSLAGRVENPDRISISAPGEPFTARRTDRGRRDRAGQ
jgi:hypothetical protein